MSASDELDEEEELELLLDEDEELELSFSVVELELSWLEVVLSCVVLSAELCCSDEEELSSLRSGSGLLSDDCGALSTLSEDELETVVETRARPSDVCVTSLTATFVAPSASTIDMIANGVNNGGVRFAILLPSFLVCFHLPILLQFRTNQA